MKIYATYETQSKLLVLHYDEDVQAVFAKTSRTMSRMLHPAGTPSKFEVDPDWYEDIGQNTEILRRLGAEASRTFRVQSEYLSSLLTLASWITIRLISDNKRVEPFRDLLLLLAGITPVVILVAKLPPADEVLDRNTQQAAWSALEMLRSWKGEDFPELPVLQAHNLWAALRQVPKPNRVLKSLIASLETETFVFHAAMEDLAIAEMAKSNCRKGGK